MELRTARLHIRPYRMEDEDDLYAILSDPLVMEHCEPVYDRARTRDILRLFMDKGIALGVALQGGPIIGHLLWKQEPGEEAGIYEIGWIFARQYWGHGYAHEAAAAVMAQGFSDGAHKVVAQTIDPQKSVGLMKKLGMDIEGVRKSHTKDLRGNWVDLYVAGKVKPED